MTTASMLLFIMSQNFCYAEFQKEVHSKCIIEMTKCLEEFKTMEPCTFLTGEQYKVFKVFKK